MKTLAITAIILFGFAFANAQTKTTAPLTGTVYDPNGAVIVGAKVSATDQKGVKVETVTNDSGAYVLQLPYCRYPCPMSKYDIRAQAAGFVVTLISGYRFVLADAGPSFPKKMFLDIALDVGGMVD